MAQSDGPTEFQHEPVMVEEILNLLTPVRPGVVIDGTVGGGGHAAALLSVREDLSLLGLDHDATAIEAARSRLAGFGERVTLVHGGFEDLAKTVEEHAIDNVTAVMLDLGVSSPQLDVATRGFSYRFDAPLDMRMDQSQSLSAADVLNDYEERRLASVIARYGEERFARSIARQVVLARPLHTTEELVGVIKRAIPAAARRRGGHPARRTFQAIRIEVNDELGRLERGLDAAFTVLAPKGRVAVLSYHSLEDRRVKRQFMQWSTGGLHPPGIPTRESARGPRAMLVMSRPLQPSARELERNSRSESARLRAIEKLALNSVPKDGES